MLSLSKHGGEAFTLVLRQAQDDRPLLNSKIKLPPA
jgi:hypothetical protein